MKYIPTNINDLPDITHEVGNPDIWETYAKINNGHFYRKMMGFRGGKGGYEYRMLVRRKITHDLWVEYKQVCGVWFPHHDNRYRMVGEL